MEQRLSPESSNIAKAQYEKETKTLMIEFKNGSRYLYKNVPEDVWKSYQGTDSVGKFFYKYIREKYEYEKG